MAYICPVCNGIQQLEKQCPRCGEALQNMGPVMDWVGPYAPYENDCMLMSAEQDTVCIHLYTCNACDHDERIVVQNVIFSE